MLTIVRLVFIHRLSAGSFSVLSTCVAETTCHSWLGFSVADVLDVVESVWKLVV